MDLNDAILEATIDRVILPVLQWLEAETNQAIAAKVLASIGGGRLTGHVGTRDPGSEGNASGEIRALIKDAWPAGSFTYDVQAILTGLAPGTGFSGFSASGRLSVDGHEVTFKPRGLIYRYNVWEWTGKCQF